MSRKITISTYEENTVYSVHVYDSFGQEHHLGYIHASDINNTLINGKTIRDASDEIWANETKKEVSSLSKAIKECIEIDKKAGITSGNRDCLD